MRRNAVLLSLLALIALPATALAAPPEQTGRGPDGCDALDPAACMLPFPNDYFTKADASTKTGRRIDFSLLGMPRNVAGKPIDPTDWNHADGFSPGSLIVTKVPGLDPKKTGAVPITDIGAYKEPDAPVVVLDADTGKRALIWSELDSTVPEADRTFLIRPAKNLLEGHRYIVALRNLKDAQGKTIPAQAPFAALRDGKGGDAGRQAHYDSLFKALDKAGIERKGLYLAWDFTVASSQSLAGRMLAIRDDAFAKLGDTNLADGKVQGSAPQVEMSTPAQTLCAAGVPLGDITQGFVECPRADGTTARVVQGTMTVPCYLSTPGCAPAHSHFVIGPDGKPVAIPGNVMRVEFECRIPGTAVAAGAGKSRPSLYGHGLFGGYGEVGAGNVNAMAHEHNFTFCATDWAGMATYDVPNVVTILEDLSSFNTLADRVQQGMLNFLMLGRLMIHPDGLCTQEAFQKDGKCLLDTSRLYYDGNSQGGIIGGSLAAVAVDHTRAVLGVPGMNYSTLLTRSIDFGTGKAPDPAEPGLPEYAWPLYTAYPNGTERQLIFSVMQMLWDRAEANGYAQHMTSDPLPNTPKHEVLLHVALGDHQVAPVSAEVEARTIGAKVMGGKRLDKGRYAAKDPFYAIDAFGKLPGTGSALVVWDSGSPVPPTTNTPPAEGKDPHSHPRNTPAARAQKAAFLAPDSKVVDTCGAGPCYANGYTPPK